MLLGEHISQGQSLDKAQAQAFTDIQELDSSAAERERVEYLFRLYEELTAPFAVAEPAKKKPGRSKA